MKNQLVRITFSVLLALLGLGAHAPSAWAQAKPSEIRIAYPGVGIGNRPFVGGTVPSIAHLKGLFEQEFEKDGIKITWTFLRGAGPAVNELYANGLVDFSPLGDLPFIVGQASGLKRKVLASAFIRGNLYLVVPSDSPIQSIKDLRGKKVAIFKGTNGQLAVAQVLEKYGLTEKDIRAINMNTAAARAAIVTKDVEAYFGNSDVLSLRDQGVARVVYTSKGDDPRFLRHGVFIGNEDFIKKYPEITQRVVNRYIEGAKWIAEHNDKRPEVFQLWSKSGVQFSNYKEDFEGLPLKVQSSPLLDPYLVTQIEQKIQLAHKFGLIKRTFDFRALIDDRFLKQALKDKAAESVWQAVPPSGDFSGVYASN